MPEVTSDARDTNTGEEHNMEIVDNGPEPNVFDLETATEENTNYLSLIHI